MNRIISSTLICIMFISCNTKDLKVLKEPRVDKRVELLSIVFRLAGCDEYSSNELPIYVDRINSYFEKFRNHELIKYIQDSIRPKGVSFGTVMEMAINITAPPVMKPITPFTEDIPNERWGKANAEKFLKLLNKFYNDSNCELFFKNNEELYQIASKRFFDVYKKIDVSWYKEFYGEDVNREFIIVNALSIGGCNYGVKTKNANNEELAYAIMGACNTDSLGLPVYKSQEYFPTLIHEFNHSFVNPNVEIHLDILFSSGTIIIEHLRSILKRQGYSTWKPMYFEALVRASVIKYLKDHSYDENYVNEQLTSEINRGFVWTKELVDELDRYSCNRNKYASFNDFMPELAEFFNQVAEKIEDSIRINNDKRPSLVDIFPFNNGDTNVNYLTKEIRINFNKEIKVDNKERLIVRKSNSCNIPEIDNLTISNNNKSIILKVSLQSNQNYKIILNAKHIKSNEGYNPKDFKNIKIDFSTISKYMTKL